MANGLFDPKINLKGWFDQKLMAGAWWDGIRVGPPGTPAGSSPSNAGVVATLTPGLVFAATDYEQDDITYNVQIASDNLFTSTNVATYAFDAHLNTVPGTPDDPNSVWTNDANGFDGSTATITTTTTAGSTASNYLYGKGTAAPASGGAITQVRVRIYSAAAVDITAAHVYTAGLAQDLGTATSAVAGSTWGSYVVLTTPTGGWSWSVVQQLEVKAYWQGTNISGKLARIEIEVTSTGSLLTDVVSGVDPGFSGSPDNTDPFTSGQSVTYTVQSALTNLTTYYWRVRAKDPLSTNGYGPWSSAVSFTVNTSAIPLDTTSLSISTGFNAGPVTKTWTHTTSGTNRLLILTADIWQDVAGTGTISSASYNGVAMTKITQTNSTAMSSEMWYLIAPALGANTVSVTVTGATDAIKLSVSTFTNAAQVSVLDNQAVATGASGNPSASVTTLTAGALVVATLSRFSTTGATTNRTSLYNENATSTLAAGSYQQATTTGSYSDTYTGAAAQDWSMVIASFKPAGGGTLYTSTLTASLSFAGSRVQSINKGSTASLSFSGALPRSTSKGLSAGLSFSGAFAKVSRLAFTASLSFTGAVARAVTKTMTASLSFTGSIARFVSKSMTASLSFIGAIRRAVTKGLAAASLSFTGAVGTSMVKLLALTASLSFSGSITRSTSKPVSASLSFVGALARQVSKGMTAALNFTGSIAKLTTRAMTASLSFVGAFVRSSIRFVNLTASLSFVGAIARTTSHTMTAGLSFSGNLLKRTAKAVSASISFTGTLTRQLTRSLTASLSFVGAFVRSSIRFVNLTASLNFTGAISRFTSRPLTSSLSYAGSLSRRTAKGLAAASLSFIGAITKRTSRALTGSVSFVGNVGRRVAKAMTAGLSFIGSLTTNFIHGGTLFVQNFTASLSFSGSMTKATRKSVASSLNFIGAIRRATTKGFTASVSFVGSLITTANSIISEFETTVIRLLASSSTVGLNSIANQVLLFKVAEAIELFDAESAAQLPDDSSSIELLSNTIDVDI